MVHTLKVIWTSDSGETEIRRLTVPDDIINHYNLLAEKVLKLFPSLSGQCFQLGWKDSEGDYIVMSSDDELAQAVANAVENGIIKIFVTVKTAKNADHKPKSSLVHPNVVCDGCTAAVCGYRYKCLECFDYDLCESCHVQDKHPGHDMLKISTPVGQTPKWMFPGWRRMYRSMFGRQPFGARCSGGRKFGAKFGEETDKKEKKADSPSSPHAEFLKNIGKSVAFFLDPLGIDVDVMVSENDTDNSDSSGNKKGAEAQTEVEVEPKNVAEEKTEELEKDSKKEAAASPASEAQDEQSPNVTPPQKEDSGIEANVMGARPRNYGLFRSVDNTSDVKAESKDSRGSSPDSFSSHGDWTVVNNVPNVKEEKKDVVGESAEVDKKVSYPELPEEKMASNVDVKKEEVPQDAKVANALLKMYAMGFSNEGGWLLRLLETKNGNINEVLDALYPNRH